MKFLCSLFKECQNEVLWFLFPKINFKRDIIRSKIWFPFGKHWLANNMTGQADIRLCKLEGGWRLVKSMYKALLFSLSSQRSKEVKKIIMPDLRLCNTLGHFWAHSKVLFFIFGNPGHEEVKMSSIWLRKSWQVFFLAVRVSPKTIVLLIKIKTEKSVWSVNTNT